MDNQSAQQISSIYENFIFVSELSAALWVHISALEVTLRKFIFDSLSLVYKTESWWLIPNLISARDLRDVLATERKLHKQNRKVTPLLIAHNMSLSFWVELMGKRYHKTIWLKIIKYFPTHPGRREDFYKRAREIRNLRNLIAHHAPILHRNLLRDHQNLHELTMILDPQLAHEVQKRSRVLDLLLNTRLVGSGGGI